MEKPDSVDALKTWNFDGSSTGNVPTPLAILGMIFRNSC